MINGLETRVLLPSFHLECSIVAVFLNIAIFLGKFVYFDERSLSWEYKTLVGVLVEIDVSKGIVVEILVVKDDQSFLQSLDFWKAPFMCVVCTKVRHLK